MKKAVGYLLIAIASVIVGLVIAELIWSLDIPEWLKVFLIAS